MGLIPTIVT